MSAPAFVTEPIRRLRDGERLSRDEFERRYEAMPDVKAELLDGVVYVMSSPVSVGHCSPHGELVWWAVEYKHSTPGVDTGVDGSVRLADDTVVQPDVCLWISENHGGQSRIDTDNFIAGAPEITAEVAKSSLSYDRNVKLPVYRKRGIREVVLWRIDDEAIDWFVLRGGDYELLAPDRFGIVRSETFPGLWLDVGAMIRGDGSKLKQALQQGITSPEHAKFVERLQHAAVSRKK